jgi:hypothetical protein
MNSLTNLFEIDKDKRRIKPTDNSICGADSVGSLSSLSSVDYHIIETHLSNIRKVIDSKKRDVSNNFYTGVPIIKCNDETLITHLESTYILLKMMNDRLTVLEK